MPDAIPPSQLYPVRVYFGTTDPEALLEAGYDSIRVERRKTCNAAWVTVSKSGDCDLDIQAGRFNYYWLDVQGRRGYEYRAVLQNSDTPGTPADVPQPVVRGVDTSFEAILTVKELKETYLWGQDEGFITDDGDFQPDYAFVRYILYGIEKVQKALDIRLLPERFVEKHDYVPENFARSGSGELFLPLDQYPVLRVESVSLKVPRTTVYDFPTSWISVDKDTGHLDVVPDGTGSPAPRYSGFHPRAIEVTYWSGFEKVPGDLVEVVGKEAAFGPLNVGGDLIGGAGLAGESLSLDGASQSITTTNSSTNAGFGARLIQYEKELKETYRKLQTYYKGIRMQVA